MSDGRPVSLFGTARDDAAAAGPSAAEFNLWCAMNDRPLRLHLHRWGPEDSEWCLESEPGTTAAAPIYGTGSDDEATAVAIAYGFVAGIEWSETQLSGTEGEAPESVRTEASTSASASLPETAQEAAAIQPGVQAPAGKEPSDTAAVATPGVTTGAERKTEANEAFALPESKLLGRPSAEEALETDEGDLADHARKLETVLRNFRVRGEIMEVRPGPCVTLFELEPVPGTKSSTVINLADDIARSMSAVTARIALVPGRSVIGIELPNDERETVYLSEILESDAYEDSKARLPLALGKNIGGEPVVVDLARMPHLLIAGTTGSGKSVGINAMILSLLYRLSPEQVRLILVDPKMLELSVYDHIPHLLTPVVTDPHKAVAALKWTVREMENRYRAMSLLGVRNIEGYNAKVAELAER
ncbi:MAG TPA: DNA translocase FtsK, partial [Kiloniellales bacterium]|nr:DNA translocase FtsK [Kiloniellales bacterium]